MGYYSNNVNGDTFDIQLYSKTLENKTLEELISLYEQSQTEILGLESEKKDLVYQNYRKFLKVTDKVKKLNATEILDNGKKLMENLGNLNKINL